MSRIIKKENLQRITLSIIIMLLIITHISGAIYGADEFPLTVEDALGRRVTINEVPERIISLAPSNTQTLFAMGLEAKIVGVIAYDSAEGKGTIENVGDAFSLDFEKIVSLSPDLILAYGFISDKDLKRFEDLGFLVIVVNADNLSETLDLIDLVGKVTGCIERAHTLIEDIQRRLDNIQSKVKDIPEDQRPRVFYEAMTDNSGIWTTGNSTFQNDLILWAGGTNIAANKGTGWFALNTEDIIVLNPQVYVAGEASWEDLTVDKIKKRVGFNVVDAVKKDRVYLINPDIVSQPAPAIIEGIETLARFFYPQIFIEETQVEL